MAAILETDQPPWVSAIIKQLGQVNHALEDINEMKNDFTKLTNSFVNFKMEIVYKINQMEESVKFCFNHYDEFHKTKAHSYNRLTNSFVNFKMEIVYKINQMEESVKFCSNQYDEFHKTKGSLIEWLDKLEKEKNKLETKLSKAVPLIDDQQQYSRRNCLLFHGVKEESSEDTDVWR